MSAGRLGLIGLLLWVGLGCENVDPSTMCAEGQAEFRLEPVAMNFGDLHRAPDDPSEDPDGSLRAAFDGFLLLAHPCGPTRSLGLAVVTAEAGSEGMFEAVGPQPERLEPGLEAVVRVVYRRRDVRFQGDTGVAEVVQQDRARLDLVVEGLEEPLSLTVCARLIPDNHDPQILECEP